MMQQTFHTHIRRFLQVPRLQKSPVCGLLAVFLAAMLLLPELLHPIAHLHSTHPRLGRCEIAVSAIPEIAAVPESRKGQHNAGHSCVVCDFHSFLEQELPEFFSPGFAGQSPGHSPLYHCPLHEALHALGNAPRAPPFHC